MKKAFTLAEMLMTLGIIGVISAITVPGLKKFSEEQTNIEGLKKAHATIANATEQITSVYGPIRFLPWNEEKVFTDLYIPKFNILKNCKKGKNCFPDTYKIRTVGGGTGNDFQGGGWYTFITADGMYWMAARFPGCNHSERDTMKNACGYFEVDVNGGKEPNMEGVDIFGFAITADGVHPFGDCPGCSITCPTNAWTCTAKLLKEQKYSW